MNVRRLSVTERTQNMSQKTKQSNVLFVVLYYAATVL